MCVPGRYRVARSLSTRGGPAVLGEAPRDDALDDLALRIGIVLDEDPVTGGQLPLRRDVPRALVVMRAEPVAEGEHPGDLGRAGAEDVEVDVRVRTLEQPVLVPRGL